MKRGRSNDDVDPGPRKQHVRKTADNNNNNNRNARKFALRIQILELERLASSAATFEEQRSLYAQMSALRHALHALR